MNNPLFIGTYGRLPVLKNAVLVLAGFLFAPQRRKEPRGLCFALRQRDHFFSRNALVVLCVLCVSAVK